jgi:hypothetical protein
MLEKVHRRLMAVTLGALALLGGGWILHRFGLLPQALVGWMLPLSVVGLVAVSSSEALEMGSRLVKARRLRWTGRALVLCLPVVVVSSATEHSGWNTDVLGYGVSGALTVVGAGLLVDAWYGTARRLLPRIGIAGAAATGSGLVALATCGLAGRWMPWALAGGLLAILCGGVAGAFARRQIQQSDAFALGVPNTRLQMEHDLAELLVRRQKARS